jgi:hypothetical protein
VPTEDVVNVLRNVHKAVVRHGHVLDIHPIGTDLAVSAGTRGIGFVDASRFLPIVQAMDELVAGAIDDGLFEHVRSLQRHVAMRFDGADEALEHADGWSNLRLPHAVRRRLRGTEGPVVLVDTISYRLLRTRSVPRARRST